MTELRHNNDDSIHERIQSIYDEENADRKAEIADSASKLYAQKKNDR